MAQDTTVFRNFTISTDAYKQSIPNTLPQRPSKLNTNGREAVLTLNTFNVINNLASIVYQYDVSYPLFHVVWSMTNH